MLDIYNLKLLPILYQHHIIFGEKMSNFDLEGYHLRELFHWLSKQYAEFKVNVQFDIED